MNEYPYETPYPAIHFTETGRAFTRRLRQLCWYRQADNSTERAKEVLNWPPFKWETSYGSISEDKIGLTGFIFETVMYRLVNEIRRPDRPFSHHLDHDCNRTWLKAWVRAIVKVDNPGTSPEIEAVLAEIETALEKAAKADPVLVESA